jgi:hypothetical protein
VLNDVSTIRVDQLPNQTILYVRVGVDASAKSDKIVLDVAPDGGAIVAEVVVAEPALGIEEPPRESQLVAK